MSIRVVFAVAGNKHHDKAWTASYAQALADAARLPGVEVHSIIKDQALPDHNKNHAAEWMLTEGKRRFSLTDVNRNAVVGEAARQFDADYLYWWDDDTTHPPGTLARWLKMKRPFLSGVYHLKQAPYPPVAYLRNPNGSYRPARNWRRGELITVDSVGMGCALVAREVYEGIQRSHAVYRRSNFSLLPVPLSAIRPHENRLQRYAGQMVGNLYVQPMTRLTDDEVAQHALGWPFYALEYGRTEDHHFCELAAAAGYQPLLDTEVQCDHQGMMVYNRRDMLAYEESQARQEEQAHELPADS